MKANAIAVSRINKGRVWNVNFLSFDTKGWGVGLGGTWRGFDSAGFMI